MHPIFASEASFTSATGEARRTRKTGMYHWLHLLYRPQTISRTTEDCNIAILAVLQWSYFLKAIFHVIFKKQLHSVGASRRISYEISQLTQMAFKKLCKESAALERSTYFLELIIPRSAEL